LAYGYSEIGAMRCFEQLQKISGDVSIPTIANTYSGSSQLEIEGGAASSLGIVTMTGAGRLSAAKSRKISAWRLSDVCPVPSHFLRLIARFPFTSFAIAVAAITSQKDADRSA
jgi:hypothetical protein